MYLVYRNNMQMYLTENDIVIKTWNRFFTIKAGRETFELIKRVVSLIKEPCTYERIVEEIGGEKNELNRALGILIKTKVVLASEDITDFDNPYLYRYENALDIKERMDEAHVVVKGCSESVEKILNEKGILLSKEKGTFLLLANSGTLEDIDESLFKNDYDKTIVFGEEKNSCYIIVGDASVNDIRKIKYKIRENVTEGTIGNNQKIIFENLLAHICFNAFYLDHQQDNLVMIDSNLAVTQDSVTMTGYSNKFEYIAINQELIEQEPAEELFPDFDIYVNSLSFIGYFGSMKSDQFPLPKQETWLIDEEGNVSKRIAETGEKCETAMLQSYLSALKLLSDENDRLIISDDKEQYYFNLLAEKYLEINPDNLGEYGWSVKNYDFWVTEKNDMGIYRLKVAHKGEKKDIYFCNRAMLERLLLYTLVQWGAELDEATEIVAAVLNKNNGVKDEENVIEVCKEVLKLFGENGVQIYEVLHPHSRDIREYGIYLGTVSTHEEIVNG